MLLQMTFLLIHARKASPGLDTGLMFCHPFIRSTSFGDVAFCHNGTINKRNMVSFSPKFTLEVDSDSERFLYAIITEIESNPNQDISKVLQSVLRGLPDYSGANYFLLTSDHLWASTNFSETPLYFTMYYTIKEDLIVIGSEKFEELSSEWKKLENHAIIEINQKNGSSNRLIIE